MKAPSKRGLGFQWETAVLPSSVFWNPGTGPEKEENGAIPALMASVTDGVIISSPIILYDSRVLI